MEINWLVQIGAALIPLVMGFIWYHPKVLGTAWMKAAGLTAEKMNAANMPVVFGLTFLFSLLLSFTYGGFADHWVSFQAFFRPVADHGIGVDPATPFGTELKGLIDAYGERYNTWRHGAVHGLIMSIMFILPVMAINAMFERKSFKYILINWGYWAVTIMLMFMVLAQWGR
ncbi:MAG: DUF1761 domain-containing protein [Flavobacteriales bacterium]|nr:DUF1761 domain-containing protein [Flavobacteriales bacterium]